MSDQELMQGAVPDEALPLPSETDAGLNPTPAVSSDASPAKPAGNENVDLKDYKAEETIRALQSRADSAEAKLKQYERGQMSDTQKLIEERDEAIADNARLRTMYAELWWDSKRKEICARVGLPSDLWENVLLEPDEAKMETEALKLKKHLRVDAGEPSEPVPPPAAPGIPQSKQDVAKDQRVETMKKNHDINGLLMERIS
jgi:hypothetical protein